MKIIADSHLDHGLTQEQIDYLMAKLGHRDAFFIETVDLPPRLGTVPCGLHGPVMGDDPVPEAEVTYAQRGERPGASRLCDRAPRDWHCVTLIAGPHGGDPCVLYTAFGGPLAPKEPTDPTLTDDERAASEAFWAEHALSR
jgi:hypothetical protein